MGQRLSAIFSARLDEQELADEVERAKAGFSGLGGAGRKLSQTAGLGDWGEGFEPSDGGGHTLNGDQLIIISSFPYQ
ncbi:MAG: hypothetical protein J0G36_17070 [Afipia sp.]|jgi:hypothetical protein|uniref:Uncharacterized protein n=1 Tax=Afipia massiliensis TaxID=211460 RepID=A0A840N4N9_9BRAD|nr:MULTISPECIES: hypothetical protein [Afipia]MBB5053517.1 hypothetical protein [Afipia massiliensis]MBN9597051.1 hypothetical protein [Afipia sp.]MBS4001881.1 hypothetical protein [Afipia sp.]